MNESARAPSVRSSSAAKTERTRRAITEAALHMFLERGFSATRMIDVAHRAGLAKGTLYLYFNDKEALFEGILREAIGAPVAGLRTLLPDADESVQSYLRRVGVPFMRGMERSGRAAVIRLVVAEGPRFPRLAEAYDRLVLQPLGAFAQDLARRAVARGEIGSDALDRFPLLLLAPGLTATIWNGLYGTTKPIDAGAAFEAYLDLIFQPPR